MRIGIVGLILFMATGVGHAQPQPRPKFDVTVVKAFEPHPGSSVFYMCKGGSFVSNGVALKNLIRVAYRGFTEFSVPGWADEDGKRYLIEGKSDIPLSEQDCWLAIQDLLEDRFKLKLHREVKEVPAYALVLAKGGAKLRESPPGAPSDGVWFRDQRVSNDGWHPSIIAVRLGRLPEIGRLIVDRTGLTGKYQFRLDYAARADEDKPDIFAALQQQLGLKLEPIKTSAEFVVIDNIEKPSLEN
jgi:uncharacterized protein (TIGR03435 family)